MILLLTTHYFMSLTLHTITNNKKSRKRLGRGNASGRGTYCTRGRKGQRARSGGKSGLKLKGFKANLLNLPKYKGTKSYRPDNQVVKISEINKHYKDSESVNPGTLFENKLISSIKKPVKILKNEDFTKKVEIVGCLVSASAKESLAKAGGKFIDIEQTPENDTMKKESKTSTTKEAPKDSTKKEIKK